MIDIISGDDEFNSLVTEMRWRHKQAFVYIVATDALVLNDHVISIHNNELIPIVPDQQTRALIQYQDAILLVFEISLCRYSYTAKMACLYWINSQFHKKVTKFLCEHT